MIFNTEKTVKYESLKNSLSYYKFSSELSKLDENKFNKKNFDKNISSNNFNVNNKFSRNKDVKK